MKFNEKTAQVIIERFGLKENAWRVWKTRNKIPDKYFDESGKVKQSLGEEMEYIIQRNKQRPTRAKSNLICPYCFSDRTTQREKGTNIKKCLTCKRSFNSSPDFQKRENRNTTASAHITLTKRNEIIISRQLALQMRLSNKNKLALAEKDGALLLIKNKNGFSFHNNKTRKDFRLCNWFFAKKIREFFDLPESETFNIEGEINEKNEFIMKIYNKINIPKPLKTARYGTPFLSISKFNHTRLSAAMKDVMMLAKGDKIVISEEEGKLFIAVSTDKNAFNITISNQGNALITASMVGRLIKEFFKIEPEEKVRVNVSDTPVEKENHYFFQLLNIE